MAWSFYRLGDSAVLIEFGSGVDEKLHQEIRAIVRRIEGRPFPGFIECVPAFTTLCVYYDPMGLRLPKRKMTAYEYVCSLLREMEKTVGEDKEVQSAQVIDIPVCYGGEFGPDLGIVAELNGLTGEEVVSIHSSASYLVYAIGFAPGFPYLGGMPDRIAAPRKQTPRLSVPAGSVGIAGAQTGIYPIETPGGWQIIGRTSLALFRPEKSPPTLLQGGDYIRFRPIGEEEYRKLRGMEP